MPSPEKWGVRLWILLPFCALLCLNNWDSWGYRGADGTNPEVVNRGIEDLELPSLVEQMFPHAEHRCGNHGEWETRVLVHGHWILRMNMSVRQARFSGRIEPYLERTPFIVLEPVASLEWETGGAPTIWFDGNNLNFSENDLHEVLTEHGGDFSELGFLIEEREIEGLDEAWVSLMDDTRFHHRNDR